jgi:hypothetical protein
MSLFLEVVKIAFARIEDYTVIIRDEADFLRLMESCIAFKNTRGLQPDEWLRIIRRNTAFHHVSRGSGARHARVEVIA